MLVALGGRVADLLGAERTFRAGSALFVAASALCGLARSEAWITGARDLQGVGAAMMVPVDRCADRQHLQPAGTGQSDALLRRRPV